MDTEMGIFGKRRRIDWKRLVFVFFGIFLFVREFPLAAFYFLLDGFPGVSPVFRISGILLGQRF